MKLIDLKQFLGETTLEVLQFIERSPESEIRRRGKSPGSIVYQLYEAEKGIIKISILCDYFDE